MYNLENKCLLIYFLVWYKDTIGHCRGGNPLPSLAQWDCSLGTITRCECEQACTANPDCAAFDQVSSADPSECCIFGEGNTGDGNSWRTCFLKQTGLFCYKFRTLNSQIQNISKSPTHKSICINMFVVSRCEDFNGIQPTNGQLFCCATGCGNCVQSNACKNRPGGEQSCCRSGVPVEQRCGKNGQRAPCHLEPIGKMFIRLYVM